LLKNWLAHQCQHGNLLKIQAIFRPYSPSGLSPDGERGTSTNSDFKPNTPRHTAQHGLAILLTK
jgi:hypothetical protein